MKTNKVVVLPYDKNWDIEFEKIKNELLYVLEDVTLGIEHIGSTAVKGVVAEPIIDIDVIIPTYDCFNIVIKRLKKIGYKYEENPEIKDRESFKYIGKLKLMEHNLYVCPRNSKELKRHIAFRNYLINNKKAIETYNDIKINAVKKFPNNINKYGEYKSVYIKDIYRKLHLL